MVIIYFVSTSLTFFELPTVSVVNLQAYLKQVLNGMLFRLKKYTFPQIIICSFQALN